MPKVSICIPTYNNVHEVERLLFSVFLQTYTDYEVVITDNSTNSEIEELIDRLDDKRIHYVHNEKNLGHIGNWNKALTIAEGSYIKIMFSDDWFTYSDSLEKMVNLLEENQEADFAFSNSMQVSKQESSERKLSPGFIPGLKGDWRYLFLGNEIGAPSDTIFRNKGMLFNEKRSWAADMEFYMRTLSKNPRFAYTTEPLISIGLHEAQYTYSFSKKDMRRFNDHLYMYKKYRLWENDSCKDFFLREYLVKYGAGQKLIKECRVDMADYIRARLKYLWQDRVLVYVGAAGRKVGLWKEKK